MVAFLFNYVVSISLLQSFISSCNSGQYPPPQQYPGQPGKSPNSRGVRQHRLASLLRFNIDKHFCLVSNINACTVEHIIVKQNTYPMNHQVATYNTSQCTPDILGVMSKYIGKVCLLATQLHIEVFRVCQSLPVWPTSHLTFKMPGICQTPYLSTALITTNLLMGR